MSDSEDVFRAKRKPKNPIRFRISLNDEQKEAKQIILNTDYGIRKDVEIQCESCGHEWSTNINFDPTSFFV